MSERIKESLPAPARKDRNLTMQVRAAVTLLLLVLLALPGCGNLFGPDRPPDVRLVDQGVTIEGLQGAYCWAGRLGEVCVDPMEPQFPPGTEHALPTGEPIRLQMDKPLPRALTLSLSNALFGEAVATESFTPAEEVVWGPDIGPGTYVLSVDAAWPQGDVTWWFYIALN